MRRSPDVPASLLENPSSYEELIHRRPRSCAGKAWRTTQAGYFDERFGLLRPRGEVRWVAVHGFRYGMLPAKSTVLSARFEKSRTETSGDKVAEHLAAAESAKGRNPML